MMVRRRDDDSVSLVAHLFDHLALVGKGPRDLVLRSGSFQKATIDIAQANDVFTSDLRDVSGGAIGRSDTENIEFFIGCR